MKAAIGKTVAAVAAGVVVFCGAHVVANQVMPSSYGDLGGVDRSMIDEVGTLASYESQQSVWPGFSVTDGPLFALKSTWEGGYLINPSVEPSGLFAKKIDMPEGSDLKVYRVAGFAPDMLQFVIPTNFNSIGERVNVLGTDVYYLRYDDKSFGKDHDSGHFATLLSHEKFHYLMQTQWDGTSRPDTEMLSDKDLELLQAQYDALDGLADLQDYGRTREQGLSDLLDAYIEATEKRIAANPEYMAQEQQAETIEGTATYAAIKASDAVGYPFAAMWASKDGEAVTISFSRIASMIREGSLSSSTVGTDWVYQSGAVLCNVLDATEYPDWREKLNSQTKESPVTLYQLIKGYRQTTR